MKVFSYTPEGSEPLLERLTWNTDVLTARSGAEYRRSLRSRPRYHYEYTLGASDELTNGYAPLLVDLRDYTGDFLMPLWPHASIAPARPVAGLDASGLCLGYYPNGVTVQVPGEAPDGVVELVPLGLGRLTDARKITHSTDALAQVKVAIDLYNHAEVVAPFAVNVDGLPVFDFASDWSAGTDESLQDDENVLDYDGIWQVETRYRARTVSLSIFLDSPAEIARFRSFLFAVKGAYLPFLANPGFDQSAGLWRLNSDAVEILYVAPGLATSKITLKKL
jgi:hypothetical protein